MFKINDTVLYGTDGICKIAEITQKNFNGKSVEYYVLKSINTNNSTVFVPTDNENLVSRIRRVLTVDEIHEIIKAMPDGNTIWIEDENARKNVYNKIISDASPGELVKLIKTLYLHKQDLISKGRKLHVCDERCFKEAERMLYDEFALVLNIKYEEVLPFITKSLS